jgi:hypothetical protein
MPKTIGGNPKNIVLDSLAGVLGSKDVKDFELFK